MSFKNGDRVRVRKTAPFLYGTGVIISALTNGECYVDFDSERAERWGRYIHQDHLELEPEPETKSESGQGFRIGQRVRVLDTFPVKLSWANNTPLDRRGWTGVVTRAFPGSDSYAVGFEGLDYKGDEGPGVQDIWYIDAKYLVAESECVSDKDAFWIVVSVTTINRNSKESAIECAEIHAEINPGKRYYVLQAVGFAEATTAKFQELNKMKA